MVLGFFFYFIFQYANVRVRLCEGHGDASNSKLASSVVTYLLPEVDELLISVIENY